MKNFKNIISTLVFAILLVSASLICVLKPETAYSTSERRPLANFPKLNVETVTNGEFMQKFDEYATDQFPLRDKLRSVKAYFKMNIFVLKGFDSFFSSISLCKKYSKNGSTFYSERTTDCKCGKRN